MAKKLKASDYNHLVQFYKPGESWMNPETYQIELGPPVEYKKIWCKVETIFRESLQSYVDGVPLIRNRIQLTMRYRTDIDSTMFFEYKTKTYNIGSYGDNEGDTVETRILGEVVEDGGS